MTQDLSIVFPSSPCKESVLQRNLKKLEASGFNAHFEFPDSSSSLFSSSIENRASELSKALLNPSPIPILCARGGYGASDLLPYIPWSQLKTVPQKWLVGFSDISALHSALFTVLGWPSIHGPMPGTEFWGQRGEEDLENLFKIFQNSGPIQGSMHARAFQDVPTPLDGVLFGGCLSVLCNLIGTPYFPESLDGYVLFLEDTGESPGSILRMINQMVYSKTLVGVKALILGNFEGLTEKNALYVEITKRTNIPIFVSDEFGHQSPNFPLIIGSKATLSKNRLNWSYGV